MQARFEITEVEVLLMEHLLALAFGLSLELAFANNERYYCKQSGKVGERLAFQCNRPLVIEILFSAEYNVYRRLP